jgi:dihydroorotate dehydrogenase electron transfer subunit
VTGVVHVRGEILSSHPVGAYFHLTIAAPAVAEQALAGQFVALAVGGDTSAHLLRRSFSIHRADPGGERGGTVEIVVAARGPGTVWLTGLAQGVLVDVVGPLGNPFPLPDQPVPCVLVGGGYGSAPMFWLADVLRGRGCHVELVIGAASADRLFGLDLAPGCADGVTVTTDDGSAGQRGWVSGPLPDILARTRAPLVYACGPMAMLRAVTEVATAGGAVAQVAVEEAMACGIGVCMTCVMPVVGEHGVTSMVRCCVEGPVFRGDRVRWDAFAEGVCRVPADAVGAPSGGGH